MYEVSQLATWITGCSPAGTYAPDDEEEAQEGGDGQDGEVSKLLEHYAVLVEYGRCQELLPAGMYAMPSLSDVLTWNGVIFVKQGLYHGGVFKFDVLFPEDYPHSAPRVHFVSEIFHPLVHPRTGDVDVSVFIPEWRAGRDYASFLLPHLHKALHRPDLFTGSSRPPLNPKARQLFVSDPAAFAKIAAGSARTSIEAVHEVKQGSSLQFSRGPSKAHDKILWAFNTASGSDSLEDRKSMFIDWFCNTYSHQMAADPAHHNDCGEIERTTSMDSNVI